MLVSGTRELAWRSAASADAEGGRVGEAAAEAEEEAEEEDGAGRDDGGLDRDLDLGLDVARAAGVVDSVRTGRRWSSSRVL
jgi:hypothetical protein